MIPKLTLTILFASFLFLESVAQQFNKSYQAAGNEDGHAVKVCSDGNLIVVGQTTSFGAGQSDFFLLKLDPLGSILWQKVIGGSQSEWGTSISVAETQDLGFVIVGGTYSFSSVSSDLLIVKVDQFGNYEWSRKYNTTSDSEHGRGVSIASNGDILVSGSDNANGFGSGDGLVLRLDSNGGLIWSRIFGGGVNDHFHSCHELSSGNIIVAGSSTSFGPGSTAGYLLKLNSSGTVLWDFTYGANGTDAFNGSLITASEDIICVGVTTSFGNGSQILASKLDTNGLVLWSYAYGGPSFERGASITPIPNTNEYYILANTQSFGSGGNDFLILRIDDTGQLLWSKSIGTNLTDGIDLWAYQGAEGLLDGGVLFTGSTTQNGGNEDVVLIRSDSIGSILCDYENMISSVITLSTLNPATNQMSTGNFINVNCTENISSFNEIENCWCAIVPYFDEIEPICINSSPPVLPATSINGLDGTWSPSLINTSVPGDFIFEFTPSINLCSEPIIIEISILDSVDLNFSDLGPYCQNEEVILPVFTENGVSGSWSPSVLSTMIPGEYPYTFTTNDAVCQDSIAIDIVIQDSITITFSDYGPFCINENFSLPNSSLEGFLGSWSPSVLPQNAAGDFSFLFTPDTSVCSEIVTLEITINDSVPITFSNIEPYCLYSNDTLPNISDQGFIGTWVPPFLDTSSPGSYLYTFDSDTNLCVSPIQIEIVIQDSLQLTFSPLGPFCLGENVTLPSNSIEGISGIWSPSINSSIIGVQEYTFLPLDTECVLSYSAEIEIVDLPTLDFTADTLYGCDSLDVTFTPNSSNGTTFVWDFGDGSIAQTSGSATHVYGSVGCHDVSVIVTNESIGCQNELTIFDLICLESSPVAFFELSEINQCDSYEAHFLNLSTNGSNYIWVTSIGDTVESTEMNDLSVFVDDSIEITLFVENDYGCFSEYSDFYFVFDCGCTEANALNYNPLANYNDGSCLYPNPGISAPNVFTPNKDGSNDYFELDFSDIKKIDLVIINRWGNIMFEGNGPNPKWDGYVNGKLANDGTYFYKYEALTIDDKVLIGHGFVVLVQ